MANTRDIATAGTEASILLVGDSGTGKTVFCGTIPEVYILDTDAGMASLRGRDVEYDTFKDVGYGEKPGKIMKERGFNKWGDSWPAFVHKIQDIADEIEAGTWGNRPVAIDSLTTLMQLAMNHVLAMNGRKPTDGIRINDWGMQIGLVEMVLDQLAAWPIMLVCTAHVHRAENEMMGGTVEYLPLLTGKFSSRVSIYFDEVWYATVSGKTDARSYKLITSSTGMYKQAKTRYNVSDGLDTSWESVQSDLLGPAAKPPKPKPKLKAEAPASK